jgi:hypothetical protein
MKAVDVLDQLAFNGIHPFTTDEESVLTISSAQPKPREE